MFNAQCIMRNVQCAMCNMQPIPCIASWPGMPFPSIHVPCAAPSWFAKKHWHKDETCKPSRGVPIHHSNLPGAHAWDARLPADQFTAPLCPHGPQTPHTSRLPYPPCDVHLPSTWQVGTVGKAVTEFYPGVRMPVVAEDTAAARSGLRSGDLVLTVDGWQVWKRRGGCG
eukprot:365154-Chlamydomonas_euryale.AAC.9